VTVGLPVLNGGLHLARALEGLLSQDYANFEVLISDNVSTDSTPEICREYTAKDKRIRYVRRSQQVSAGENFNYVLSMAAGKYFMWAAHDDLREPTFISRLVGVLEEDPANVLAFCEFDLIDETDRVKPRPGAIGSLARVFRGPYVKQLAAFALLDEDRSQKATLTYGLYRRSDLVTSGGFALETTRGGDILMLMRLLRRGHFVLAQELLFHYRLRSVIGPGVQAIGPYMLRRLIGRTPGHHGNLMIELREHHLFHAGMRTVVREDRSISASSKLSLVVALFLKELALPLRIVPAAFRELRWSRSPQR
jgi:glycosyltransferase involved in cell wall biosynthesis